MPQLVAEVEQIAAVVARRYPALGIEVRDVGDIGAQPHLGAGIVRIDFERAEEPAEGELLLVGNRLLREDEHAVAVEGRLDLGKDSGITGRRQIDAADLGAEGRMKRGQLDRHIAPHPRAISII